MLGLVSVLVLRSCAACGGMSGLERQPSAPVATVEALARWARALYCLYSLKQPLLELPVATLVQACSICPVATLGVSLKV
jgi:predicted exporter